MCYRESGFHGLKAEPRPAWLRVVAGAVSLAQGKQADVGASLFHGCSL